MSQVDFIGVVYERIKSERDKLNENALGKLEVDSFNLADFWDQFGSSVQSLSNEVTKIGFMCGKKPYPKTDEVNGMLQDMLQHYNLMRDLFTLLPEEVGATVYEAVRAAVLGIMNALLAILHSLTDLSEKGAKERLTLTGTFWDACNAVESLPRNNLNATLKILEEETALAADAQEELTTTIEEDQVNMSEMGNADNSELWTNPERDLATKSVGLVKVTQLCLQRLQKTIRKFGSCSTPEHCKQLDHMVQIVRTVSPALDDFVSELYHPIDVPTATENAGKLVGVLQNLLSTSKNTHFSEGISKDMDKILLFISHNHNKLDPNATNPVPELNTLTMN